MILIDAFIYVLARAITFNVILPLWYLWIKIKEVL